jgi:hypothetical protein
MRIRVEEDREVLLLLVLMPSQLLEACRVYYILAPRMRHQLNPSPGRYVSEPLSLGPCWIWYERGFQQIKVTPLVSLCFLPLPKHRK